LGETPSEPAKITCLKPVFWRIRLMSSVLKAATGFMVKKSISDYFGVIFSLLYLHSSFIVSLTVSFTACFILLMIDLSKCDNAPSGSVEEPRHGRYTHVAKRRTLSITSPLDIIDKEEENTYTTQI